MNLKSRQTRRSKSVCYPPSIEVLESRCLLTAISWANAPNLGISFAPDGTKVADYTSELHSAFNAVASETEWKSAIERAFTKWTSYVDASTHTVSDSGDAFGTPGAAHGDPRFGEVRIAAIPGGPNYHAFAVPHDEFVSGTWSGDIVFNSDGPFDSVEDIYSVALHEAGHVLGLEHSDDPNSPMFAHGTATSLEPTETDIAALQSLYGTPRELNEPARKQFEHPEQDTENDIFDGALTLNPTKGFQHGRYSVDGQIRHEGDTDLYRFEGHRTWQHVAGVTNIVVRSGEPGRLVPKATLYDTRGREIPMSVLQSGYGTLVLQTRHISQRLDYFLRIEGSGDTVETATGSYNLTITGQPKKSDRMELIKDSVSAEEPEVRHRLFIGKTQLLSLLLSVEDSDDADSRVGIAVHDSSGRLVASVSARPGTSRSLPSLLLKGGTYYLSVRGQSSHVLSKTKFKLHGARVDDHEGPILGDPTTDPAFPCENEPGSFCYDDGTVSPNPTHSGSGHGASPPNLQLFIVHDEEDWWGDLD